MRQYKRFGTDVGFRVQPKYLDLWLRNFLRKNNLSAEEFADQIGEDRHHVEMLAYPRRFKDLNPGDIPPSYKVLRAIKANPRMKVDCYETFE